MNQNKKNIFEQPITLKSILIGIVVFFIGMLLVAPIDHHMEINECTAAAQLYYDQYGSKVSECYANDAMLTISEDSFECTCFTESINYKLIGIGDYDFYGFYSKTFVIND